MTVSKRDGCLKQGRYSRTETDINGDFRFRVTERKKSAEMIESHSLLLEKLDKGEEGQIDIFRYLVLEECKGGSSLCDSGGQQYSQRWKPPKNANVDESASLQSECVGAIAKLSKRYS